MAERMPQAMPEACEGWVSVDAGEHLVVLFHRDRRPIGQDNAVGVVRPSITVGVSGSKDQVIRLDPFSVDGHYHIRPTQADEPIPFAPETGQTCLDAALALFENPNRFRGLLVQAGEPRAALQVADKDLAGVASQIRKINAA